MCDFVSTMERAGLNQSDIVAAVADRISSIQISQEYQGSKHEQFKKITLNFLINALELNIQDNGAVSALFKDEFAKQVSGDENETTVRMLHDCRLNTPNQIQLV